MSTLTLTANWQLQTPLLSSLSMQQSKQTHDYASVQQCPPETSDRRNTAGPAQQGRFEFTAGIAGHLAKRASPHISKRRGSKFESFRTPRRTSRTAQSRQGKHSAVALHSAVVSLLPIDIAGSQATPANAHGNAWSSPEHASYGQHQSNMQAGRQTAPGSVQAVSSSTDHTQQLMTAFAQMSTSTDTRTTKFVSLSEPDAACFRHLDLQPSGQKILTEVQNAYGVSGFVTTQGPANNRLCVVNNIKLQVSCVAIEFRDSNTKHDASHLCMSCENQLIVHVLTAVKLVDLIVMRRTNCFRETRLVLHVPS